MAKKSSEQELNVALWYLGGNSDKVYHVHLVKSEAGWSVPFEYGRRGNSLNSGFKIQDTSYEKALAKYEAVMNEKLAEGYGYFAEGATEPSRVPPDAPKATKYQAVAKEKVFAGFSPMLCGESIEPDKAKIYIEDDNWWMQEKLDGVRVLVENKDGKIRGVNKKGIERALPVPVADYILKNFPEGIYDGELIGEVLFLYDQITYGSYVDRWGKIDDLKNKAVVFVRTWRTTQEKEKEYARLFTDRHEGVIFRRKQGLYKQGRSDDLIKCKFTKTASFIVTELNPGGKESITVGLYDFPGFSANITTIGKPKPKIKDVVEAKYLYSVRTVSKKGEFASLTQPVLLSIRDDVEPEECVRAQLKFRREE